jgi:peroxiredoxin
MLNIPTPTRRACHLLTAGLACSLLLAFGPLTGGDDDEAAPRASQRKTVDLSKAITPVEVGAMVPDFTLQDTAGHEHTLSEVLARGEIVVLEWFNPDCPIVRNYHDATRPAYGEKTSMAATRKAAAELGVVWLAINSGAEGTQGAGLERNAKAIADYGIEYPVLLDPKGEVGRKYAARTTPHMFVIQSDGTLAYDGAIDDGSPRGPGEKNLVLAAIRALKSGEKVETAKHEPFGCSVKYAR